MKIKLFEALKKKSKKEQIKLLLDKCDELRNQNKNIIKKYSSEKYLIKTSNLAQLQARKEGLESDIEKLYLEINIYKNIIMRSLVKNQVEDINTLRNIIREEFEEIMEKKKATR